MVIGCCDDDDVWVLLAIASYFGFGSKAGLKNKRRLWDVGLEVGGFECVFNGLAIGACESACAELDAAVVADNNGDEVGQLFVL